jgi:DNA-directed RNA polymerase subunit RPC12/RpoP
VKFLCVQCDEPMKLLETGPPDRGSLAVTYACPKCSHRIAMLTNPYETQVVSSLGVRIGPGDAQAPAAEGDLSGCPFSEMVQEMATESPEATAPEFPWTPEARLRLENIPAFVRPMARAGIERYARERGYARVDDEVLDQAKDFFGM